MIETRRETAIRVPVRIWRSSYLSKRWWTAEVSFDRWTPSHRNWQAEGTTEKEARDALTARIVGTLDHQRDETILVIGGGEGYAEHIHVVSPSRWGDGWKVDIIGDGRRGGSWAGDKTRDEALDSVLRHVGGDPKVVML